jgi:hypothetical protein
MSFFAAAWEQVYGLLVEDGQIAIGTLVAFALCAGVSVVGGALDSEPVRNAAGPLLFLLLMGLLLVNLLTAGRKSRHPSA